VNATGLQIRGTTTLEITRADTAARKQQQSNASEFYHRSPAEQFHSDQEIGITIGPKEYLLLTTGNWHLLLLPSA
jgi:hypothetical protein